MNDTIIYEQPLNEIIRACLRLEQVFQHLDHQLNDTSKIGTRHAVSHIINILQLLDRPDLKAKLAKEISHLLANLSRYEDAPSIDSAKLDYLTRELDALSRSLIDSSGKIGHRLRDTELLNILRLQLANPGGACSFDMPLNHYWLEQPTEVRHATLRNWLKEFDQIRKTVRLVLDVVRNHSKIEKKQAVRGFHQELLDPQSNIRMIRIGITPDIPAYPEISVGRHFLSIRFYSPNIEKRPEQYPENLNFWLAYCN